MSVNNVQQTSQPKKGAGIADALLNQGKNALVGTAVGLATGRVVSLAMPVSHKQIAQKVVDHYVKHDKDGIGTAIKSLEEGLKQEKVSKEQLQNALNKMEELVKPLREEAAEVVEKFFKTPRKSRNADDIVAIAKKAAKKSQSGKIMGTAAAVGMFLMMFSEVFSVFTPKKAKTEAKAVQAESPSKMGTHQG